MSVRSIRLGTGIFNPMRGIIMKRSPGLVVPGADKPRLVISAQQSPRGGIRLVDPAGSGPDLEGLSGIR